MMNGRSRDASQQKQQDSKNSEVSPLGLLLTQQYSGPVTCTYEFIGSQGLRALRSVSKKARRHVGTFYSRHSDLVFLLQPIENYYLPRNKTSTAFVELINELFRYCLMNHSGVEPIYSTNATSAFFKAMSRLPLDGAYEEYKALTDARFHHARRLLETKDSKGAEAFFKTLGMIDPVQELKRESLAGLANDYASRQECIKMLFPLVSADITLNAQSNYINHFLLPALQVLINKKGIYLRDEKTARSEVISRVNLVVEIFTKNLEVMIKVAPDDVKRTANVVLDMLRVTNLVHDQYHEQIQERARRTSRFEYGV